MKTYELQPTAHPDLFRVVDRKGDWQRYFHKPSGRYLDAVNFILNTGYTKGPRFAEYLKNITPEEADRRLREAGELGDRVHQFIRLIFDSLGLAGQPVLPDRHARVLAEDNKNLVELSDDEWDCILAFQEFWTRHNCVLASHEFPVFDLKLAGGYAGTADALIRMRKACGVRACPCKELVGKLGLPDWKSGGGIYESYGSQVEAYARTKSTKEILGTARIEWTGIVRLGSNHKTTGGYEFCWYDPGERKQNWSRFLAAKELSKVYSKPFDPEKEILDIPDTLTMTVEREELRKPKAKRTPRKGKRSQTKPRNKHEGTKRPRQVPFL